MQFSAGIFILVDEMKKEGLLWMKSDKICPEAHYFPTSSSMNHYRPI